MSAYRCYACLIFSSRFYLWVIISGQTTCLSATNSSSSGGVCLSVGVGGGVGGVGSGDGVGFGGIGVSGG